MSLRHVLVAGVVVLVTACSDHAPTDPATSSSALLTGESQAVIVGFATAPGAAQLALIEQLGGDVTHTYRHIPAVAATIPAAQRSALESAVGVSYVVDDHTYQPLGSRQITDWGVTRVEAPAAWALGYRGTGVKVGIFDSGIDVDHPDLRVVGGVDLVGDGNGLDDCNGHGTHVAGIVGASANGRYTVGVAPRAQLYSMRFADCLWEGATLSKMIQGVEWAIDNGMDVVNMSFGATVPIPDPASEAAFQAAYDAGIVLVGASGNSSIPVVGYPAGYSSVIAVGATNDADMIAEFSQTGTDQELTAPGVNNLASYPVGYGAETSLYVNSDNDRELDAVALEYAGKTGTRGIRELAVYVSFGTAADYETVDCTGRIAVAMRGGTSFAEKAVAAMNAGCTALIIHNHTPGNFNGTLGTPTAPDGRAWLPVISLSLQDGLYLKEQIETQPTTLTYINAAGSLAVLSGTSMASPHVAGVAALVLGGRPSLSPDEVRRILRESAEDLGPAGWDPVFGHGLVNALRAVQQP